MPYYVIVFDREFGSRITVSQEIYLSKARALDHLRYEPPYLESFLKEFPTKEDAEDFQRLHPIELPAKW